MCWTWLPQKYEKDLSCYRNLHWCRKYTFWNARWNPENYCFLFLLGDFLNYQGRNSVGSFLTCQFYQFYLLWNEIAVLVCLDFRHSWLSFLPGTSHSFSVSAQVKRWKHAYIHYSHRCSSVQNRVRECNICTARELENGLYINEMQVFKLWPRGDLNSADTFQLPSVQTLKPKTESQGVVPAAQGSCRRRQLFRDPRQELGVTLMQPQILKAKGSLFQLNGWKSFLKLELQVT